MAAPRRPGAEPRRPDDATIIEVLNAVGSSALILLGHIQITNHQYNLPEIGKKIAYPEQSRRRG